MATVAAVGTGTKEMTPYLVREFDITSITSDVSIAITHGGPTNFKADKFEYEWVVAPTILCVSQVYHIAASDTTTTAVIKVVAGLGGDLAGATLRVRFYWYGGTSGGISAA